MKEGLVASRMGTFRAAANAFNPTDLVVGMFTAVRLLAMKIASRGGTSPRSNPRGRRTGPGGDAHLEPMAQQPMRDTSPYSGQPGITITGPHVMGHSQAYNGGDYAPSAPLTYPSNAAHGEYFGPENERRGLNPYSYADTRSREPSMDATSTRQVV